jgi:hypothetical protein
MGLLDRYIKAVRSFLPQAGQDDIANELAANIQAQMDDHAEELGRPLTEAEQSVIIEAHGHPMLVAGRYQTPRGTLVFGRQLIGPMLFPFYVRVLGLTLGIAFAIHVIVIVALAVVGTTTPFEGVMNEFFLQFVLQFLAVTAIFAIVENTLPTMAWDVHQPPTMTPILKQGQLQVPRLQSIAEIVAIVVVALWLRWVFVTPHLLFGPASAQYRLGPVWGVVVWPTAALFGVGLVKASILLIRPNLPRFHLSMRVVTDVGLLAVALYLTQAGNWVIGANAESSASTLATINRFIFYGLWGNILVASLVTITDVWKSIRNWNKQLTK